MLSCSVWFSAPRFWMGGGLERRRVCLRCRWCRAAYVPETCRAKNTSIKLPSCIKLAFHFISWGRCTVKQPSKIAVFWVLTLSSLREMCWSFRGYRHLCHHGRWMKQQEPLKFMPVSHPKKQPYLWVFRSSGMWYCVDMAGRSWHLWTTEDEDTTFIQNVRRC